ncbi:uncharacterized protein LOC113547843 isoform X1 [Rhopalosiphum maidis]|uniref:uncharacterized protein LOC113547843 isoform X1 n=1 Tax=Rhopalosiphum maidis TaxID=43146 RepID=UPI000F0026EF|nr:uncharacterized protein LOC113547843 isoform X1 [Rhopalosiphum maidis]
MVSDHEIFERITELMDTPVSVLCTNRTIKGVSINIHTNTLYIIDSSSSLLEFSNNKINILTIERHLLQNIKIDWVNNILYILIATTNLDTINYSVKILNLKENTLEDLLLLFCSKPLQIEEDPC